MSEKSLSKISREEKGRLLRMGKRNVKGPFNALVDPTQLGAGSAMLEPTEAVKKSGTYDVWEEATEAARGAIKGKGKYKDPEGFLFPLVSSPTIKVRHYPHPEQNILNFHPGAGYRSPT